MRENYNACGIAWKGYLNFYQCYSDQSISSIARIMYLCETRAPALALVQCGQTTTRIYIWKVQNFFDQKITEESFGTLGLEVKMGHLNTFRHPEPSQEETDRLRTLMPMDVFFYKYAKQIHKVHICRSVTSSDKKNKTIGRPKCLISWVSWNIWQSGTPMWRTGTSKLAVTTGEESLYNFLLVSPFTGKLAKSAHDEGNCNYINLHT